jgi:hypothetical protein
MDPTRDAGRRTRLLASGVALVVAVAGAMVALDRLAPSQPPAAVPTAASEGAAQQYARTALELIGAHTLGVDPDTWPSTQSRVLAEVAHARTPAETHDALEAVVFQATSGRGRLVRPDDLPSITPPPDPVSVTTDHGLGFLTVPAVDEARFEAASERAASIARAVQGAAPAVSCGWAIDLRGSGADTDYGAVAGLAAFLPEGQLFSLAGRGGDGQLVTLAMATVFVGSRPAASANVVTRRVEQPVAVLQDGRTNRSSESLLLSLRRSPGVRTFGTQTSGLPTGEKFHLSDGALLRLPTRLVLDADGLPQHRGVHPTVDTDAPERRALAWLRTECRQG